MVETMNKTITIATILGCAILKIGTLDAKVFAFAFARSINNNSKMCLPDHAIVL